MIAIELGDADWQDVAQCLAYFANRRSAVNLTRDRAGWLQRRLDEQLTRHRLRTLASQSPLPPKDWRVVLETSDGSRLIPHVFLHVPGDSRSDAIDQALEYLGDRLDPTWTVSRAWTVPEYMVGEPVEIERLPRPMFRRAAR